MKHRFLLGLTCIATLTVAGCHADAPTDGAEQFRIGQGQQEIQGGYFDDFDKHAVGLVRLGSGGLSTCSGTLIAPNMVLTAQHCVAPTSGGGAVNCSSTVFGNSYPVDQFYVTTLAQFTQNPSNYHTVLEVRIPAGPDFCGNDQAILILDGNVPESEATPAVPRVDTALDPGEEYYAVGYGAQFDSNSAPSGTRQRRDSLFTDCVGACGFGISETEWLGDTGVCSGDSGGPAFDLLDRVVGVASRGGQGCSYPVYGSTLGWGEWIKQTAIDAAVLGGYEHSPWAEGWPTDPKFNHPIGGACTDPNDCPSGVCLGTGECSRWCSDAAPCPESYVCAGEGWCEQAPAPEPDPGINNNPDDPTKKKKTTNKPNVSSSSGCSYNAGKDPTKPIPWKWAALMAGLAWLGRRRRGD